MESGHPIEHSMGMEFYSTRCPALGGRLKKREEDFIVEEITPDRERLVLMPWDKEDDLRIAGDRNRFITMSVQKSGLSTMDLAVILASELNLPRHMITYAGLKDRRAVTVQQMSIPSRAADSLKDLKLFRIKLGNLRYERHPVQIGDLWGNHFTIHLTDMDTNVTEPDAIVQSLTSQPLLNYFGVQRFGIVRPPTHLIGKALVKGDYEGAIRIMLTTTSEFETGEITEARVRLSESFEFDEHVLNDFPDDLRSEREVISFLIKNPGEYERAVTKILPRIQTLMVHAYQSYLFNRILSQRLKQGLSVDRLEPGDFLIELDTPHTGRDSWRYVTDKNIESSIQQVRSGEYGLASVIPGYATKMPPSHQTDILREVLKSEDVQLHDFRDHENKNLDSPGGLHLTSIDMSHLTIESTDEGILLKFQLRKGSYATVVMREIMRNHPINRI